jgi:hypothetical protein
MLTLSFGALSTIHSELKMRVTPNPNLSYRGRSVGLLVFMVNTNKHLSDSITKASPVPKLVWLFLGVIGVNIEAFGE